MKRTDKGIFLYEATGADDLLGDGQWITVNGKHMFIGGVQRKKRPKKPKGGYKKMVKSKMKDGTIVDRPQYSKKWTEQQQKFKFAVTAALARNIERINDTLEKELSTPKQTEKKAVAAAALVMSLTGMRIGGDGMTDGKPTYGCTTLEKRHVKVSGDSVSFDFRGKSGIQNKYTVKNKALAEAMKSFMDTGSSSDDAPVFTSKGEKGKGAVEPLNPAKVSARMKKFDEDYKPKDLRTLKANEVSSDKAVEILNRPVPVVKKKGEIKKARKQIMDEISEAVSSQINNEPNTSKSAYINPLLFEEVFKRLGLEIEEGKK